MGNGAEEGVDGNAPAPGFLEGEQLQMPVRDGHLLPRRDDVDAVRRELGAALHLPDGDPDHRLEHLRQMALVLRREVHDDHEGNARIFGDVHEEVPQSRHTAGGSADAHERGDGLGSRGRGVGFGHAGTGDGGVAARLGA